jgi:YD repeat-containing protein
MSTGNSPALASLTGLAALLMAAAPPAQEAVQYGYDALGRAVTVTYGSGIVTTYAYDAAGNRAQITTGPGSPGVGAPAGGDANPVVVGERRVSTTAVLSAPANHRDPSLSAATAVTYGSATIIPSGP